MAISTIDLAALGSQGITINGAAEIDLAGTYVSDAGDYNNDGIPDILVGAPLGDPMGRVDAGQAYVIFGGLPAGSTVDLATLGTQGITINGAAAGDEAGRSVSTASDFNNDGLADVIVGAQFADPMGRMNAGQVYVIFGGLPAGSTIDLAALGTQGITINGAASSDTVGLTVSDAGDFNNDGIADIIVGALFADPMGRIDAGQAYVIFGGLPGGTIVDLAALGTQGITINGAAAGDKAGVYVSDAGDINTDGIIDVIVGAHLADPMGRTDAGQAYVIFGGLPGGTIVDLAALGTQGITINGAAAADQAGISVSNAGDFNNDGIADVIIGARLAGPMGRIDAGQAYVIFGGLPAGSAVDLAALGTQGITINGAVGGDEAGFCVSDTGDFNNDGIADVIIGARLGDPMGRVDAGQAYVIFGGLPGGAIVDLATLGAQGITINGAVTADQAGFSVSDAKDFNNDGIADGLIGANLADPMGQMSAGRAYIIFGIPNSPSISSTPSTSLSSSISQTPSTSLSASTSLSSSISQTPSTSLSPSASISLALSSSATPVATGKSKKPKPSKKPSNSRSRRPRMQRRGIQADAVNKPLPHMYEKANELASSRVSDLPDDRHEASDANKLASTSTQESKQVGVGEEISSIPMIAAEAGTSLMLAMVLAKMLTSAYEGTWHMVEQFKSQCLGSTSATIGLETKPKVQQACDELKETCANIIDANREDKWLCFHMEDIVDDIERELPEQLTEDDIQQWQEEIALIIEEYKAENSEMAEKGGAKPYRGFFKPGVMSQPIAGIPEQEKLPPAPGHYRQLAA